MRRSLTAVVGLAVLSVLSGCGGGGDPSTEGGDTTVMVFSQAGAENGWRTANTRSIQEAAVAAGIELKFSDAQPKQESQIRAIRSLIQQKVDVIAFSPAVETGWDSDSDDTSLCETFLGSDFVSEGEKAGQWLPRPSRP